MSTQSDQFVSPDDVTSTFQRATGPARQSSVVAIYDSHVGAEQALKALQRAGIDMARLSIVGKDFRTEEQAVGFYTAGDRMRFWGGQGAFWGSLWGMLFGGALFFIPVVGHVIVLGPMVGWIVGALEGAAVGGTAGVLAGALASVGVPSESVIRYQTELKTGKYLVIARGPAEMVHDARRILGGTGASEVSHHEPA